MGRRRKKRKKRVGDNLVLEQGGIDTHAHLDLDNFSKDLFKVIERAQSKGVSYIINVFLNPKAYYSKQEIFSQFKKIYFTLGIHPHEADKINEDTINEMISIFKKEEKLRAVGEIGLDFYRNYSEKPVQIEGFKMQLEMARQLDLPVVIHSREAEEDTLDILKDMNFKDRPLLWHCFTKDINFAEKILEMGWMISIPGPVTFPKTIDLQKAVAQIPLDRIVVETDCPFLTPHPFRGTRNEPGLVVYTAKKIAELKELPIDTTWSQLAKNGKRFFNIK